MRPSTLIVGLFAPIVLAFPFAANKRAANKDVVVRDVYHYATVIVTVPPTPVELTAFEEYGYIRHRHSKNRQGSPTPIVPFEVLSTTESVTVSTSHVTPSLTPTVQTSFVAGFSNLHLGQEVVTIETAPPTRASVSVASPQVQTKQTSSTSFVAGLSNLQLGQEVVTIETAPPTPASVSVTSPQVQTKQTSSSVVVDSETRTIAADITLPSTFIPNLDPTSSIYKGLTLQHHNIHRRNHSAEDLTWNNTLAGYAETTAKTCIWGHSR